MAKRSIETEFVHAGERRPLPQGLPNATPIFASSTYSYESMEEADRVFSGDLKDYIYTRYGNPTVDAFQDALCVLKAERSPVPTRREWRHCTPLYSQAI